MLEQGSCGCGQQQGQEATVSGSRHLWSSGGIGQIILSLLTLNLLGEYHILSYNHRTMSKFRTFNIDTTLCLSQRPYSNSANCLSEILVGKLLVVAPPALPATFLLFAARTPQPFSVFPILTFLKHTGQINPSFKRKITIFPLSEGDVRVSEVNA